MIDVAELRALIGLEQLPLTDIEAIFCALVAYPQGEQIPLATRADLTGALEKACASLIGDTAPMPRATRFLVLAVAAEARIAVPAGDGTSYQWGAAAVEEAMEAFVLRLAG